MPAREHNVNTKELHRTKALVQLGAKVPRPFALKKKEAPTQHATVTVLLVEDEPIFVELVLATLPPSEYNVLVARSVPEAIEYLQKHSAISIVLCDLRLPGQDGFAILEFVQLNMRFQNIPIVMCTACAQSNVVKRAFEMGAVDYLAKPYSGQMLLHKVESILISQRLSILLVSGEGVVLNLMKLTFERKQCQTFLASSGVEALKLLDEAHIDVIISDLALADCSGPDLLAQVRERGLDIPFFFLDDPMVHIQEESAISSGAHGMLRRPWNGDSIYRHIAAALPKHRRGRKSLDAPVVELPQEPTGGGEEM